MSFQSLERQLNAITQKLEAIHSDVHGGGLGSRGVRASPGSNNSNTGSPRIGRSLASFTDQPSGRQRDVIAPSPPPPPSTATPEASRSRGANSAILIKEPGTTPREGSQRNIGDMIVLEESVGRSGRALEASASASSAGGSEAGRQSPQSMSLEKGDKKKSAVIKQAREAFFKRYAYDKPWHTIPKASGVSCVWLGCIAIAVEYVTGMSTTMEMLMTTNNMAVHYVSFPSVTLAELFDTALEYLEGAELTQSGVKCEVATFDSITVDDVGDEIGMGERLPVMTLAAFRKELSRMDSNSMLVFNYDPYVVQEAEIDRREAEDEEFDEDGNPIVQPKKQEPVQWAAKNQGNFALLLQFNSALHTVTIGTPHLGPDGVYRMEAHTVSLHTMYSACCVKDGYTNKSRGFVRIYQDRTGDARHITSLFPVSLLDGRDAGGLLTSALDVAIAPHILGLSMLHHVVQATLLSDRARRRQSTKSVSDVQLRGIPVTKFCDVLGLPVATLVGGSTKDSVACAFAWYHMFLTKLGIQNDIAIGIVTVTRKGGAEDGAVNVSDEQFLKDISMAVATRSVMLISFDVNVALNVVVETKNDPCHFGIVIGIDESHGIVKLADVNVKKYRKVWHVPITRLYNATIKFGYIIAAKSKEIIDQFNCQKYTENVLGQARYGLPADPGFTRFEYPNKNYTITVLADALDRLGFADSNVESFVHNSGFHVSFLLSEHIPLASAARIATFYSHVKLDDMLKVTTTHYDDREEHTKDLFVQQMRDVLARKDASLLINFQPAVIQKQKSLWNGGMGGPMAILIKLDEHNGTVTVCDANFSAYYRTWSCPISLLYDAMTQVDRISGRARGTLLLEKQQQRTFDDTRGYDQRRAMVHHPFKPTISTTAATIALAASEMMQKSYSQEQFIYNALEFDLCKFTTRAGDVDAVAADANHAFLKLQIPLVAVVMPCATEEAFRLALAGTEGLLSVTIVLYDTQKIHKTKLHGNGAAVVNNRGEDGIVKVVDGNPTVFGDFWEASFEELFGALQGAIVVKGAGDDEEMES